MNTQKMVMSLCLTMLSTVGHSAETAGFESMVVIRFGEGGKVQETYEIGADGKYKIHGLKSPQSGQLEGDKLKTFTEKVNGIDWSKLPAKQLAQGADRFRQDLYQYNVAIFTDKKLYRLTFQDSVHADNEAMQEFLSALIKLKN